MSTLPIEMSLASQEFTYLRPPLMTIIFFLFALLIVVRFQKNRTLINPFSFWSMLIICLSVSTHIVISIGYVADGHGLGGDHASFYMWLVIVGLSIINTAVFLRRKPRIP